MVGARLEHAGDRLLQVAWRARARRLVRVPGRWRRVAAAGGIVSERAWPRRIAGVVLALLMIGYVVPYAAVMLSADSVRDLSIAWQLHAHGDWPAQGPDIFSRYTLGPIWFWLLAALMSLGLTVAQLVLLVGAIASFKFPLIYLLARRLGGEIAGLVAACLLAL